MHKNSEMTSLVPDSHHDKRALVRSECDSSTNYQYEPLPAHHIRCMFLLPGSFGADIHIMPFTVELGNLQRPSYHALSYVWGDPDRDHHAIVELGESQRALPITQNLWIALQHLRHPSAYRTLWVDAICINQEDIEERNNQVSRMADIYSAAEKVFVWLGPEGDNSSLALKSLKSLASKIEVNWDNDTIRPSTEQDTGTVWLDLNQPAPFDEAAYKSIVCFLDRPWFGRLWIWQEVLLAADRAQIICGAKRMTWLALRKALVCLRRRREPENVRGFAQTVERSWRICQLQGESGLLDLSLPYVLHQTRNAQCSDQRDRIYAVLNLVPESLRLGIQPDYNKSVFDVFWDVTIGDFKRGDASLLTHCELSDGTRYMPSWIPNWSDPKVCVRIWAPRACWRSRLDATILDDHVLAIKGVCAARITSHFPVLPDRNPPFERDHDWLMNTIIIARAFLRLVPDDLKDEMICRTLCNNLFTDRFEPRDGAYLDFQETIAQFLELTDKTIKVSSKTLESSAAYEKVVRQQARGRALIITDNGRSVGLAPQECRENDYVVVLLGCQSPLILRQIENGRHIIVGECYVQGLMNGEALLGPLPENWKQVLRYDEATNRYYDAFIDRRRGVWQVDDPRLGHLPIGWALVEHTLSHIFTKFRNETQEGETVIDPRMTSSHLRERGVECQTFYLR